LTEATLFVVATPIGNLDDLTPRARKVLGEVDIVAAEDTRVTGRLLSHFGIKARQISLHEHNEERQVARLLKSLQDGRSIALVSDAGTPLISDPGYRLIRAAREAGVAVSPIPGASAVLAALSVSGLSTDRFRFEGFLPTRKKARAARLAELAGEAVTVVFFESVHRVAGTLQHLAGAFGGSRRAFIARELTKLHEQCVSGELDTLVNMLADGRIPLKGEFVIITEGVSQAPSAEHGVDIDVLLAALSEALPAGQAAAIAAAVSGASRKELYKRLLVLKSADSGGNSGNKS
jgi:16S rRNA (cytidine1402-2'-O)-methyltransferase